MSDPQVLHGLQAIDQVMQKPELAILSKCYNLLYQSLIPNCKLTIKILRRHFTITDQVEQYILSGDSRRLCCQRVMNVLLVHLDIVKDHHQFCDWLNSVSVMGSLIDKIKSEYSSSSKWDHRISPQLVTHQRSSNATNKFYTQQIDTNGSNQLGQSVMDNVIISCTVSGEEALVDKACSCSGSRRLVRHRVLVTMMEPEQDSRDSEMIVSLKKKERLVSSLNLKYLFNYSDCHIVNTCLPVLCESLPDDYQSAIEKLKTLPQFLGAEQQQQLNSLIPTTLTDVKLINEKIITFIVITLSFSNSSGGMTQLCDIMDELIGSTSCVQEIRCATSIATNSSQAVLHRDGTSHPEMRPTPGVCSQDVLTFPSGIAVPTSTHTCSVTVTSEMITSDDVVSISQVDEEGVLGIQLLKSHYSNILNSLPSNHKKTLGVLQHCFTDDQMSQILSSPDHIVANKTILEILVDHFKTTRNLKELCDRLEKITTILQKPELLISVICELKAVTCQDSCAQPKVLYNNLSEVNDEEVEVPIILSVSEDFSQLKTHFHTIVQLMPDDYEQSVGKLQSSFSDEQICNILSSSNCKVANNKILNCLIEKLSSKEDLLDLCVQLEKITASHDLLSIMEDIKSSVVSSIQLPHSSHIAEHNSLLSQLLSHPLTSSESIGVSSAMFQLAFRRTSLNPNSKVVAVLKKNFVELCRCLPKDHVETIKRLKRRVRVGDRLKHDLDLLPSIDERNGMILAIMLGPLHSDVQVLTFCDVLEDVVDNSTSKKFIHKLRSEVIEALSTHDAPLTSADDETLDDGCTMFFDRSIAQNMDAINPSSKALAILRNNFSKLCHCLPDDYKQTISRIRRTSFVPEGLMYQLALLPTTELANCTILAAMIRPLRQEILLVEFCDSVKELVDSTESKAFIENLKHEVIAALTMKASNETANSGTSGDQCIAFFDQEIAHRMNVLDSDCKTLSVLRKNFAKLCHCLPEDYKQTISRVRRFAIVPQGLMNRLSKLPFELANRTILGGMIRPLREEVDMLGFCDSMEELVDGVESKKFIEVLRNELIEALSDPTGTPVVTTVNTIQPSAMIFDANSDITCMFPGETQPVVNAPVTDVPLVTETICTQPTAGDEELLRMPCSTGSLLTTAVTTTTTTTSISHSATERSSPQAPDINMSLTTDAPQ